MLKKSMGSAALKRLINMVIYSICVPASNEYHFSWRWLNSISVDRKD